MQDIAFQLVLKWAREGEDKDILLTDDYTRLTLDTIALYTMDYRFNSFYSEAMHPFVKAMSGVLSHAQIKATRPGLYNKVFGSTEEKQFKEDQATMNRIAQGVIDRRRAQSSRQGRFTEYLAAQEGSENWCSDARRTDHYEHDHLPCCRTRDYVSMTMSLLRTRLRG